MLANQIKSVELFSGAGGLALGMSKSGFRHELLVEFNKNAVETLVKNHDMGQSQIKNWNIRHDDVNNISFKKYKDQISVVAGGPPCQPFSLGGKHKAFNDSRDMFPQAVRAVREARPDSFIFENVKGLLRKSFSSYFEYIILQLTYPNIIKNSGEYWEDHLSRLEETHTKGNYRGLKYNVVFRLVNAADYGVPQKRERVFIVGFRSDLNIEWSFPKATHSQDALLWQQWVTGEYWDRLNVSKSDRPKQNSSIEKLSFRLQKKYGLFQPEEKPWVTVREAINDLPCPKKENNFNNHKFRDGAKSYPGHTGSPIDEPSKTLKAGDHGVPGGENMIRFNDDSIRYFTVREAARIQTFPDDYHISGVWSECMRQIGNAVPVSLAEVVARSVYSAIAPSGVWSECMRQIGNAVPVSLAEVVARSVYSAIAPNTRPEVVRQEKTD
ncbi:DNA (cytosine-5-)-methyltransferase [Thiolapillus brandeum]|uniref:DNA (cytosine-5-)-methyltransferase n=1 Tax=Thiolapillus brandeum TaxID=1076588 RepID=A0A7U6JI95_9GAMM|nr:DNA (cytosine-5-)-methyltransferase [Thiolapillus brandeum]